MLHRTRQISSSVVGPSLVQLLRPQPKDDIIKMSRRARPARTNEETFFNVNQFSYDITASSAARTDARTRVKLAATTAQDKTEVVRDYSEKTA